MPNLIKQGEAKVVTKNGEVFVNIALELNIKLDGTNLQFGGGHGGPISNGTSGLPQAEDKVNWEIPDFTSNKINFGKGE